MYPRYAVLMSVLALGTSLLSGCHTSREGVTTPTSSSPGETTDPKDIPPQSASCDAGKARFAIGQRATDALLERARVAAQAERARFLRPNQPVTMEFLASRLNLNLDSDGIVRSSSCG